MPTTTGCIEELAIMPGEDESHPVSFVGALRPSETLASGATAELWTLDANGAEDEDISATYLGSPSIIASTYVNRYGATIPINSAVAVPIDASDLPEGTYKLKVFAVTSLGSTKGVHATVVCTSSQ